MWIILYVAVLFPAVAQSLNCSECERGTIYASNGASQGEPWTTGNCSTFSLESTDETSCSQSDEICVYRFELYVITNGQNLTHAKRECTTYAALSGNGVTNANFSLNSCVIGSTAEPAVTPYQSAALAMAGFSRNDLDSYGSAYFCVFDGSSSQFVPTVCSDGTVANSCSVEQNSGCSKSYVSLSLLFLSVVWSIRKISLN